MFKYDAKGIAPWGGGGYLVPPGKYRLKISNTDEGKSKKGDYMVTTDFKVVGGEHAGKDIRFHNVVFFGRKDDGSPKPGAGIAVHFLKCIGQPWEGDFEVNHLRWRGKEIFADVVEEEYNGKVNNRIKEVYSISDESASKDNEESVPF